MHLPYLQLTMEVIELAAPDIAVHLDADEAAIGWGAVKLFRWALQRCPDHLPPSASDVVTGPHAAKLIARAAAWAGDPEAFVDACCAATPALLERVPGGIRVRGLDRYDAAWGKSHPEEWREWKAQRAASVPEPERNRAEPEPVPALQTKNQNQIQKQLPPPPEAAEPAPVSAVVGERLPDGSFAPTPDGWWAFTCEERRRRGLEPERKRPRGLERFHADAMARVGPERMVLALARYFDDAHFAERGWPTAIFVTEGVWFPRAQDAPPRRQRL